ncbi:hypothetical protein T4E_1098 [Trichinella pseudospiralis]|uniref:Uncharacterized protein n=1 Tax=Trichinella pseudospiralis TaxID=6337 RepID=A0A0V0XDY3_TRIPS|nr:hypothetical protein T4E_1098 [Trichinella pseudospiralis]
MLRLARNRKIIETVRTSLDYTFSFRGGDESLSQGAVVIELTKRCFNQWYMKYNQCGVGNRPNGKRPQAKLPAILQAICK